MDSSTLRPTPAPKAHGIDLIFVYCFYAFGGGLMVVLVAAILVFICRCAAGTIHHLKTVQRRRTLERARTEQYQGRTLLQLPQNRIYYDVDEEYVKPKPICSVSEEAPFCLDMTCTICLREFYDNDGNIGLVVSCGHYYHLKCITTWLELKKTCPNCRTEVSNIEITNLLFIIQMNQNDSKREEITDHFPTYNEHANPFVYNEQFVTQEIDENDINIQLQEIYRHDRNTVEPPDEMTNVLETALSLPSHNSYDHQGHSFEGHSQGHHYEGQVQLYVGHTGQVFDDQGNEHVEIDPHQEAREQLLSKSKRCHRNKRAQEVTLS